MLPMSPCSCNGAVCLQVSRLMGMGADENVADQIAGKLEDMLEVVRKVGGMHTT